MFGAHELDWKRLRVAFVVFAVASSAGGGAAGAAWWHERGVVERLEGAGMRLSAARARHLALAEEREQWHRLVPEYRDWATRGRIGEERPGQWEEAVRNAASAVLGVSHRLGSPVVSERKDAITVHETDLSLEVEMRHEGELAGFLHALERRARGLFTVSGCRLVRTRRVASSAVPAGPLDASCRLRWQTVALSEVEPGWLPPPVDGATAGAPEPEPESEPGIESSAAGGSAFGRLFTTAAERARIDSRRDEPVAAEGSEIAASQVPARDAPVAPPIRWLRVGGVVVGSGGSVIAWIDGRRAAPPPGATGRVPPGIRVVAGGRSIVVAPGQRFNPATGAVSDPFRRSGNRFGGAQSLRKSSRVPLTDFSTPGQN